MSNEEMLPSSAQGAGSGAPHRTLRLRHLVLLLSIAGLLVSLYLVYIKFNPGAALCAPGGGCEAVNTSRYSAVGGIPIAIFGALAYLAIGALTVLETRMALAAEWGLLAEFGLSLAGVLYSAYLTYLELAVIHQVCPYCVTSAVLITAIFIVTLIRMRKLF